MLANLQIRDLALIEEMDLELSPGFNVLTGETGAGKSLIATAIDLLLGRRARGDLVRMGSQEAEIQGLFDISDEAETRHRLTEAGLPAGEELLVRRVIPASGRHRCYVNGRSASLSLVAELTAGLANVMSQHEHHALLDPAEQLRMLDGFGKLGPKVEKMTALYSQTAETQAQLDRLKEQERDRAQRLDYLSFQLGEIEKISPRAGELEETEKEIDRLRHMETLLSAAKNGAFELYEGERSIFDRLSSLATSIDDAARHDPTLAEPGRQLAEAAALVEDVARFLSGYGDRIEADPQSLSQLEERQEDLKRLMRRHGTDLAGVLSLQIELQKEIETLSKYEEALEDLESTLAAQRDRARTCGTALSRARDNAGRKLARAVRSELDDLAFGAADFQVRIDTSPAEIGPVGADRVEFLVALNPGEGVHPLRKVASGGELSRLMLATKRALAGIGPHNTYVFDEVDAGITGAVAASVGRKLREVARHHQVICITHLPQISGMADAHFFVSKAAQKGRTSTDVRKLDHEERIGELARMLSGEKVTDKSLEAAKELLARPRAEA